MPAPQKPSAADLLSGRVAQIPLDTDLQAPPPVVSNAQQVLGAMPTVQEMSGAQASAGMRDVAGRAAASVLGTPVDLAAMALAPLGYQHPAPVLGSEWIGQKMQDAGMVSPERRPAAELLADLAAPAGLPKAAASSMAIMAAMSPEGKARLLADLLAGKGSGTYRLGDVTAGQAKALQNLGLPKTETRDVMMTDEITNHLLTKRMGAENFSAEDMVLFAEKAMAKESQASINVSKTSQQPQLANRGLFDKESGRRYDAEMPFKVQDGFITPATVFPDGLRGRNKKPPEKPEG